jgi:hypothetical protein
MLGMAIGALGVIASVLTSISGGEFNWVLCLWSGYVLVALAGGNRYFRT